MIWPRNSIKVGGKRLPVRPLTLENALELALLLGPHLALIEDHLPEIRRALTATDGGRPRLLSALFTSMRDDLASVPGDMTRALALMLDCDPIWLAERITAQEFVKALPVLDEVNDLTGLWDTMQALGITARYRKTDGPD